MKRVLILLLLASTTLLGWLAWRWYEQREARPAEALVLYGNVDIRQVELGFRVEGRVDKMFFEEGDLVTEGILMAQLDPQPYVDEKKREEARLTAALVQAENADILLKRRRELIDSGAVSQEQLDDADASFKSALANVKTAQAALGVADTRLGDTALYSPSNGILLSRIREPGTVLLPGQPIYSLTLLDPVWVRAFVNEPQLGLIYPGMKAFITNDTPGSKVYQGHVGFISPVAEFTPKTVETTELRTSLVYRVRIIVDNADLLLRQGMPVTVTLPLQGSGQESGL